MSAGVLERGYVWVGDRQIHYRSGGSGAPIVMLHPSPLSSAALLPMAVKLAEHFTVVALDTPGYGQSDPMPGQPDQLSDYAAFLGATLDALGLDRVCLYGAATGAQVAVAFGLRYPERVAQIVMDAAGHVDDAECERVLGDYFPDLTPRSDGAHLAQLWQAARDLAVFFPWSDRRLATRLNLDVPAPEVIQHTVMGYLDAGRDYARAYRAAFWHERAGPVQALKVSTVITRWESSIVIGMTDALLGFELPANVTVLPLTAGLEARLEGVSRYLRSHYRGDACPPLAERPAPPGRVTRQFVGPPGRQTHIRRRSGAGRPVVLVHDCDASSATLAAALDAWPKGLPVLAVDLPGHGESDASLTADEVGPAQYGASLGTALDALGVDGCDVLGCGGNAALAVELALQRPRLVKRVGLVQPLVLRAAEIAAMRGQYAPDLAPRWDGTHLLSAWQMLRDQALFWPWFERVAAAIRRHEPGVEMDPAFLQTRLVALMKCVDRYQGAFLGAFDYPLATRLNALRQPILAAGLADHPLTTRLATPALELPAPQRTWGQVLGAGLAALA